MYLLIKDGIVVNTIVADEAFIEHIRDQYDYCIAYDPVAGSPGIGWSYDGQNFFPPEEDQV